MIARRVARTNPAQPVKQLMTAPFENTVGTNANARVVEFIAKPNKTDELRGTLRQALRPYLRDQTGIISLLVLTFHEEPRRVLVITLWSTGELAARGSWEETPRFRKLLSPLIDACLRIQTYKADLLEAADAHCQAIGFPPRLTGSNSLSGTAHP
jgi:heme-degrading monooxygenase HmoA